MSIIQVAVPVPLRNIYDYEASGNFVAGSRVLVPFGRRNLVGVILSQNSPSTDKKLKHIIEELDDQPSIDPQVLKLITWAANYYHHPIGEAVQLCLPTMLRKPKALRNPLTDTVFQRNEKVSHETALAALGRAPKQRILFNLLCQLERIRLSDTVTLEDQYALKNLPDLLKKLEAKELVLRQVEEMMDNHQYETSQGISTITLNSDQQSAAQHVIQTIGKYQAFLLHGITGSGKTEIYLEIAQVNLCKKKQTLVLVPEIALTPQLIERFKARFANQVCCYHSGLSERNRFITWWRARTGNAAVVLGTRSACFLSFKNLATIIVDEEHDLSYKQQDGFRYHARDIAIKRASLADIPILLGTATPSMESMNNIRAKKHTLLKLGTRAKGAQLPQIHIVDLKHVKPQHGISFELLDEIRTVLNQGNQAILYINRRGFAPVVQCNACGWQLCCTRCDAYLTFHQPSQRFCCHHCGQTQSAVKYCQQCQSELYFVGAGTQRVEEVLRQQFPSASVLRFDRDQITTQSKLEVAIQSIRDKKIDIVVGTQLIVKGHDFPSVTLVGIVAPDQGLFSSDFRSTEYMLQQIIQVSGRAGRNKTIGKVLIQTYQSENPFFEYIRNHDVEGFLQDYGDERIKAKLPPFGCLALFRAESTQPSVALKFLVKVKWLGEHLKRQTGASQINIFDSVPSPMEKRAGKYRAQLLIQSHFRKELHTLLDPWIRSIENSNAAKKVRWSIDIDPMEMY